jgi:thimet oligopeptidase
LPEEKYQRPVVALVCNFPPPGADGKPSLLSHDDLVTVFHEFGHALHGMLTRARFSRFAGTEVPRDFVEAPSQMLENWAWDKTVLDSFAADYRDPSKKIPADVLGKMREARLATAGVYYRRQFAFAKLDLALHGPHPAGQPYDAVTVSNQVMEKVLLPVDPNTALIASFGHLAGGYDAGYYGYAWAEAIAADMATVFRRSPGGFMDKETGMKLRAEIYEPGNSREVGESIEKFLGRKRSIEPFLANNLGLKKEADPKDAGGSGTLAPTVK